MSAFSNFTFVLFFLSLFGISAGLSPHSPSSSSSSLHQGQGEANPNTSSQKPPPNYTTTEAIKTLRSSLKKWNKNDEQWKKCMNCKGIPDLKRADELESNIKHHKQKVEGIVMKNEYFDSHASSRKQKKRLLAAQDKAQQKLEKYSNESIERKLVRHQTTGQPSSHG